MHVAKTNINGNPNLGLYGYCNDNYCLLGMEVPDSFAKLAEEVLKVPVHKLNVCGTGLVGVFLTGNSNCLLVPDIAFDYELEELEKLKIKYKIIKTKHTALGNNIISNEGGAIISEDMGDDVKDQVKEALGVSVVESSIAELPGVGAIAALNSKGCLVHRDATKEDMVLMKSVLKVDVIPGTINFGSPYIKSGIICNSNGFLIGDLSGGPEIQNADEALGFIG